MTLTRNWRIFAAILLPIGPACVAVLRYLWPPFTAGTGEEAIAAIAAEPGRQSAAVWLGMIAVLVLVPAVTWVGRVTRRGAPRTTAAAMLLLVPGYLSMAALLSVDGVASYGVDQGVDPAVLADLWENGHPTTYVLIGLFLFGHVIGSILLGVAMWRSGVVARWVAVIMVLCQPAHFVAAVIVGSPELDLLAWGGNAVAFAMVSLVILRMSDEDWDPWAVAAVNGASGKAVLPDRGTGRRLPAS